MLPLDPSGSSTIGQFDGVCSPDDLDDIPEDEAGAGDDPAWFRTNYVDVIVRSPITAEEIWDALVKDINILLNALEDREDYSESSAYSIDSAFSSIADDIDGWSSSSSLSSESLGTPITTRAVTLTVSALTKTTDGYNTRVVAHDPVNMTENIFRYMRYPLNPNDSANQDKFDGVCSPSDIEDFPENAPFGYIDPKFFRLNYADLVVKTRAEAEDFQQVVIEEVEQLIRTYERLDTFDAAEIFWFGND
tara:strand:+ start:1938 stop:2681 length:744 start_codon:yes stop_codon:yes gene_type:complete